MWLAAEAEWQSSLRAFLLFMQRRGHARLGVCCEFVTGCKARGGSACLLQDAPGVGDVDFVSFVLGSFANRALGCGEL